MSTPTSPGRSGNPGRTTSPGEATPTSAAAQTPVETGQDGSAGGAAVPQASAPWLRLTRHVLRCTLGITLGTVGVLIAGWAVALGLASTGGVGLFAQVMHYATMSTVPWIAFTALVICVGAAVRQYVHAGFTRRAVTAAGLTSSLVVALVFAVATTVLDRVGLGLVESALGTGLFLDDAPSWALLGAMLLICLTGAVCGVLVGASFVRWGGWATLLLPVTVVLPYFTQDVLMRSVTLRGVGRDGPPSWLQQVQDALPPAPTAALSLLVLGLTAAGAWLVLRRIPLPPRAAA